MNPRVLRRFIILLFVATLVVATVTVFYDSVFVRPPGDYETERGDNLLSGGDYEGALSYFDEALAIAPKHRGAMMGRALVFIATGRYAEAIAELDALIAYLNETLAPDDPTGRGALAAAYANRGIVEDREARYRTALADYIKALQIDDEAVAGPGIVHKILYDPRPSTVRDRARYLYEQLKLPEAKRVLRVPELDAKQRMYKP